MYVRRFALIVPVIALTGLLSLWSIAAASQPLAPATPPTLNLNLGEDPRSLDPAYAYEGPTATVAEQLFAGLVDLDDDTAEIRPDLAISWTVSPASDVFTFTLRSALWTDGRPVTAGDARFGILRALRLVPQPEYSTLLYIIRNAASYALGDLNDPDQVGIVALDDTHLQISLEQPAAYFPWVLAMPVARPVPRAVVEQWGDAWTDPTHLVTSGAYHVADWQPFNYILLEKSPTYYDAGHVQIQKVKLWMVDDDTAWQMYAQGQLDSARVPDGVAPASVPAGEQHVEPLAAVDFYGFSSLEPPFDKPLVRKAFAAAIDRAGLVAGPLAGRDEPGFTFTPTGVFGHVDDPGVGIAYNPAQARQWLEAAGYPNGQGLPPVTLWIPDTPPHRAIAESVRDSWFATLGVSVTLKTEPPLQELYTGNYQVFRLAWAMDYPDARNFLRDAVNTFRDALGWYNPDYDQRVLDADATSDSAARRALFRSAEQILVQSDAAVIPLYYWNSSVATRPYLQRTYPAGGYFDIAAWRLAWRLFLPLVSRQ